MLRFIAQRFLSAFPVFLAVLTIVFIVIRVIPGDPAAVALGDYASNQAVQALREKMGLNEPLLLQYFHFLGQLARGDLGKSMLTGVPVREQIASVLPYTLELTLFAILIGILLGIPVGIYTAVKRNTLTDYIGRIVSLAGLSVPAFYFAILLILVFAVHLGWLPAVGGGSLDNLKDNATHLLLPSITLGLIMTASMVRLVRSAMLNVIGQDYVRTARAKGLRERIVWLRHALRSALIPIVSMTGIWAVSLVGDSVTTEIIFARPGLGKLMVAAVLQRDYTSLQSIMVVYAAFVVVINLLADLVYGLVDPRVR